MITVELMKFCVGNVNVNILISRQKSPRNPRNFIPAKILNEKINRKRQKLSQNRMNLKENARNINGIREIKSPRKSVSKQGLRLFIILTLIRAIREGD